MPSEIPSIIEYLFARLDSIYGTSWSRNFGSVEMLELAKYEWANDLGSLTAKEMDQALKDCKRTYHYAAPNLPKFKALLNMRPASVPALPRPKQNRVVSKKYFAEIRESLR